MPTLHPLPFHHRLLPPRFSHQSWSRQEVEGKELPVFLSCPGALFPPRSSVTTNCRGWKSTAGLKIVVWMWIDCQIDRCHFQHSGISAASAIHLQLNPRPADVIDQAAKGDRHCREGLARTAFRLDEHQDRAEHWYWFRPEATRKHSDLFSYRLGEMWNAPSVHLQKFRTSGMSYMRLEQAWLVLDNSRPRQPKEDNIVSEIHQHSSISSWDQLCQDSSVETAQLQPWNGMLRQYFWHILGNGRLAQWELWGTFWVYRR